MAMQNIFRCLTRSPGLGPALGLLLALSGTVLQAHEGHEFEFAGEVQQLPITPNWVGNWLVAGKVVHVSSRTVIKQEHGLVQVGAWVEVEGLLLGDGSVEAKKIEVESTHEGHEFKFAGEVQQLPTAPNWVGDWLVAGKVVHVSSRTVIKQEYGLVQVGAWVEVEGLLLGDGSVEAKKIEVESTHGGGGMVPGHTFLMAKLQPTEAAPPQAKGVALASRFVLPSGAVREDFKVAVEHLLPRLVYDVFVDGQHAGTLTTNHEGEGHLFLSTAAIPGALPLPPQLQPVTGLQNVQVREGTTPLLTGTLGPLPGPGRGVPSSWTVALLIDGGRRVVGMAVTHMDGEEQELKLACFALPPLSPVQVVIDGFNLGAFTTGGAGQLHLEFASHPEDDELPLPEALQPVSGLLHVEIQNIEGLVLAQGDFLSVPRPGTLMAPGQVRRHLGGGR